MQDEIGSALGISLDAELAGDPILSSRFAVTALLTASAAAVAGAASALIAALGLAPCPPPARIDRRLISLWADRSIYPVGWELPPAWDALAGDYRARDGWIKLHTNLAHHRAAALAVLGSRADRDSVTQAVAGWEAEALETAIVEAGGVAAALRSCAEWAGHPQGAAIAAEPLVAWDGPQAGAVRAWQASRARPLAGLRVLDLTRVIAGPVATRMLAGLGADVLRIDPPGWEEANLVPDVTLGKRCARLRLDTAQGKAALERLMAGADLLVHGYRPGALDRLGLDADTRRSLNPGLIEVTLDAYGWTGPWAGRRGFDSLVQMNCGIAQAGSAWADRPEPLPLPVQALDHATGHLMAAAALVALDRAVQGRGTASARLSLARTADLLVRHPTNDAVAASPPRAEEADLSAAAERTPWGPARRLRPALAIEGTEIGWDRPAGRLGSAAADWPARNPEFGRPA